MLKTHRIADDRIVPAENGRGPTWVFINPDEREKSLVFYLNSIMAPALVVSIFSMNVRIPLEDLHHAFWLIMGLALISRGGVYFVWKRGRW